MEFLLILTFCHASQQFNVNRRHMTAGKGKNTGLRQIRFFISLKFSNFFVYHISVLSRLYRRYFRHGNDLQITRVRSEQFRVNTV